MGGEEPSTLLSFCLSSRYYSRNVITRTASLGPVGLLLSVLPLHSPFTLSYSPSLSLRRLLKNWVENEEDRLNLTKTQPTDGLSSLPFPSLPFPSLHFPSLQFTSFHFTLLYFTSLAFT